MPFGDILPGSSRPNALQLFIALSFTASIYLCSAFSTFPRILDFTSMRIFGVGDISAPSCSANSFQAPEVYGAEILSLEANLVSSHSATTPLGIYKQNPAYSLETITFCNVTVTYTHPGQNDTIHVQIWMPNKNWNGRMQGVGGGGFAAGLYSMAFLVMNMAITEGYAAVSTDAGVSRDPREWALISPGNVNLYLLNNLAAVSLNDAAIIGKAVIQDFYGKLPAYSYWNGCSQGGRQGLMLAQRYPGAYDGIVAGAPAINAVEFTVADFWPTFTMNQLGEYPFPCEFDAITAAAIASCDGNDGVLDGVITDPSSCTFDPKTMIGSVIDCVDAGGKLKISAGAAAVAEATWSGARNAKNLPLWYGVNQDATLTSPKGLAGTECKGGICTSVTFSIAEDWIKLFILKNSTADLSKMSHADFDHLFHDSVQQYASIFATRDPDLSEFRDRGGKMITYHGLADEIITPMGSKQYYDAVTALDPAVHDYYRLFFAPGLAHCFGGNGAYPDKTIDALRAWVENGIAPEVLNARSFPNDQSVAFSRPLCPYPQKQYYDGSGDVKSGDSFYCK